MSRVMGQFQNLPEMNPANHVWWQCMLSNSAQWLSPLELDRHQSATPSPACFPTQTFWSINQSLGALLVLLNTDNGTKRSAKNIWVCWMCPDVTIQRPGHQSGGDHGSLWPHDHTSTSTPAAATTVTMLHPHNPWCQHHHQHSKHVCQNRISPICTARRNCSVDEL